MIVKIPYAFSIQARAKRTRSHHRHTVYQIGEFEIPEISGLDAPIVADNVLRGHLRSFEDTFLFPEMVAEQQMELEFWEQQQNVSKTQINTVGTSRLYTKVTHTRYADKFDEDQFRDIQENNREEAYAGMAKAIAETFVVVDGYVYSRVPEPVIRLSKMPYFDKFHVEVLFGAAAKSQDDLTDEFYRLDRWDDMLAHVEEHYPNMDLVNDENPKILIEGMFSFDDEDRSLLRAANSVVKKIKPFVTNAKWEDAKSWFLLRDSVNATIKERSPENLEAIAECLRDLSTSLEAISNERVISDIKKRSEVCLTRWDMRPISFSADFGF